MTKQLPRSRQSMLALGLGLLLIMVKRQIAQITMDEFRHEQQMFALILANSLAESFETTRVLQLMSRLMTRHGQFMDDFPADTNISIFNAHGRRSPTAPRLETSASQWICVGLYLEPWSVLV